jgi:transketolase
MSVSDTTVTAEFDARTWDMVGSLNLSKQLVSGDVLVELARTRPEICVLTADLGRPTRVRVFKEHYPERYFNFGIAERNMVGAAAGMAASGMRPYISNYACFLAVLATDNIRTDICYPNLPVKMIGTHSGVAMGFYGTSHHATEDIGFLRSIANLTVLAPIDALSLRQTLEATVDFESPLYLRVGRGRETPVYDAPIADWRIGGSAQLREGTHATIFATGNCVAFALLAATELAAEGIEVRVVDAYSLKPVDRDAILAAARETSLVFSAEEHNVIGGLGSAVAEVLAEAGSATKLVRIGFQDVYSILGPPTHLYTYYGLDGSGIAKRVRDALSAR